MAIVRISKVIFLLVLFIGSAGMVRADSVFDFSSNTVGALTAFSDTNNGVTATFSSTSDPGGFEVFGFLGLVLITGNSLSSGPNNSGFLPLNIALSTNENSISMDFATDGPGTFTLTAFEGATPVGTVSLSGTDLGAGIPEGLISFNGANFNSVVVNASTDFFVVSNIDVKSVALPEPGTMTLLGAGLLGLIWRTRKSRSQEAEA